MTAVIASERTYGAKKTRRATRRPRNGRLSSSATPSAIGNWMTSESADEDEVVLDRPDEVRVVERVAVVAEADEVGERPEAAPVEQAVVDRLDDRVEHERQVEDERRHDEDGQLEPLRRLTGHDDRPRSPAADRRE